MQTQIPVEELKKTCKQVHDQLNVKLLFHKEQDIHLVLDNLCLQCRQTDISVHFRIG